MLLRTIFSSCALLLALTGTTYAIAGETPMPVDPAPDANAIKPGLTVNYYYAYYDWIDEVMEAAREEQPDPGAILPALDYHTGQDKVLTSDKFNGVGAHIRGLINLDETGRYNFVAESNDGVHIVLGGALLLQDGDVHADRYSDIATATIAKAGWYPLEVHYFEKKNTATLRLLWRKPSMNEGAEMIIVPAAAYGHTP